MALTVSKQARAYARKHKMPVFGILIDTRTVATGLGYYQDISGPCTEAEAEELLGWLLRFAANRRDGRLPNE